MSNTCPTSRMGCPGVAYCHSPWVRCVPKRLARESSPVAGTNRGKDAPEPSARVGATPTALTNKTVSEGMEESKNED
jgi:hypothetical protein